LALDYTIGGSGMVGNYTTKFMEDFVTKETSED
jgi:hypothetical protein